MKNIQQYKSNNYFNQTATHNKQPKVSIVVPIYGVERYLNQCLDSILAQTLKDIEIILVDDGSKDRCPEIVDEYAKKDNRIIAIHQPNGGYGRAVNHGIEVAKGKYIGVVESDDWIAPTMYEELYNQAESLQVEICKASFYWVTNSYKNEMWVFEPWMKLANKGEVFNLKQKPALFKDHSSLWSAIYRKDFFDKYHIKFQETAEACYQDWPFCADVYSVAKRITILPRPLYYYRNDVNNTNSSSQVKTRKLIKIIDQCLVARDILSKNNMFTQNIQEAFYRQCYGATVGFFNKIADEYKAEFYDRMRQLFILINSENLGYGYFDSSEVQFMKDVMNYDTYEKFKAFWDGLGTRKFTVKLFSFIPLFQYEKYSNKQKYKIFNATVFKIKRMGNGITVKYYILGVPVLKLSRR